MIIWGSGRQECRPYGTIRGDDMCGRYFIFDNNDVYELQRIIDEVQRSLNQGVSLKTHGEIFPTDVVPVRVLANSGKRELVSIAAKWGFLAPGMSRSIINARMETIVEKAMFRNAVRCLVPASNYFEWETVIPKEEKPPDEPVQLSFDGLFGQGPAQSIDKNSQKPRKEKRAIRPTGQRGVFYMAGLLRYEPGAAIPEFTIVTRDAALTLAYIHDRMPLILSEAHIMDWLQKGTLPKLAEWDDGLMGYSATPA